MPEAFHVRFRVFGLRPNTCRTTADETKPPVAREKKPLVPRVRLEVNSTGSSLRSQSERAKKAIHCFRNMWNTGWRELQRNRAIRSPHLQDHLVITPSLFFHGKRKSCLWSHVVTVAEIVDCKTAVFFSKPVKNLLALTWIRKNMDGFAVYWISHIYSTVLRCNW